MNPARFIFWERVVQKLNPNNTNLKHYQGNNNKETENAVAAVVNFKKLKEEGEERMRVPYSSKEKEHYTGQAPYNSKEHYTGQAIRERMVELDFKEEFIEKILKDYSTKKIDEKLDLLVERKNIQSPAAWLMAALKNDYRDEGQESQPTPHPHLNPPPQREEKFEVSREKDLKAIKLIQKNLSACIPPIPSRKRTRLRENVNKKLTNERRFKCPD